MLPGDGRRRRSPPVPSGGGIRGFAHDIRTGRLIEVACPAPAECLARTGWTIVRWYEGPGRTRRPPGRRETAAVTPFAAMLLATACAGACMLVGGLAANVERIRPSWLETEFRHSVIAFGGGILVAAVALVLVPEGNRYLGSPAGGTALFFAGGVAFLLVERALARRRRQAPQFVAMLLDYLPECLALGGMFAVEAPAAVLLAVLIGLQNLPEGFNAFRELSSIPRFRERRTLLLMAALIPLGPLVGIVGWIIGPSHGEFLGGVMLFAAGGILYLIFQDIAPNARLERHWAPTMGAVMGFALAMLGQMLIA